MMYLPITPLVANADDSAADSLPGKASASGPTAVETPPADGNEFIDTGAGDFFRTPCSNPVDSESDFTDDNDSDAEDFWNVICAANAAVDSLPGEADDLSLVAVETPQVDGADNEEVNDSDDESESVPEDHPLVASTADNESVSLPAEADGLGLDAVEAPLTTVKGALHCSAGKACYHRPKRNGSIPLYAMPTFASAQWHRRKFAAY
ncbi:hypothetical protein LPJ57_008010 [Coemansia sp. RSA 486]|nr:hypothetical protein LPJ57_008010 [Coemansia sp. RSA 486]KAJ2236110.1 hypothetical protein IWW45_002031 [Coemansia sp. RSA 485]